MLRLLVARIAIRAGCRDACKPMLLATPGRPASLRPMLCRAMLCGPQEMESLTAQLLEAEQTAHLLQRQGQEAASDLARERHDSGQLRKVGWSAAWRVPFAGGSGSR